MQAQAVGAGGSASGSLPYNTSVLNSGDGGNASATAESSGGAAATAVAYAYGGSGGTGPGVGYGSLGGNATATASAGAGSVPVTVSAYALGGNGGAGVAGWDGGNGGNAFAYADLDGLARLRRAIGGNGGNAGAGDGFVNGMGGSATAEILNGGVVVLEDYVAATGREGQTAPSLTFTTENPVPIISPAQPLGTLIVTGAQAFAIDNINGCREHPDNRRRYQHVGTRTEHRQ